MRIFLEFSPAQTDVQRARLSYAFSLFCAIYGHQLLLGPEPSESADVGISYSRTRGRGDSTPILQLGNLYQPRSLYEPAPAPKKFERGSERTFLFFAPTPGHQPDWLGELFEWVSCADEYSVTRRDPVDRIPFADSYVGRHKLDAQLPYAAIAMQFLQRALCELMPGASTEPVSPVPSVRHFVIATHDIDFIPLSYASTLHRLAKNALISLLHRAPRLALQQAGKTLKIMIGCANPFDQLDDLAQAQIQRGYKASYFFITQHRHRRDANYRIDDSRVVDQVRSLERLGMEVGVHGSYTSLDQQHGLASEFTRLQEMGFRPEGGRQHWLRFTLDRLIPACEQAGVLYDASLGWSECIGFRGGACFAFPPYNFKHERPATFLEIPLVVMDGSLPTDGELNEDCFDKVAQVLSISRHHGWGGISLLWHNTAFEGNQLPRRIGEILWELADHRKEWKDTWVCAADFIRSVRQRYVEVGLLPPEVM